MSLSFLHIAGIVLALALITGIGIYSGRKVKNASDFSTGGGKTGAGIVAGTIMGTLVGGASTVGTAQLAFTYGFSAWWFTLGGGIGCLVLAVFYVGPLRKVKGGTVQAKITNEFGETAGLLASILAAVGTFVNIISQMMAATALISTMFPVSFLVSAIIAVALMAVYVIFGGVWGTGLVGVFKLILLYIAVAVCGIVAVSLAGGVGTLYNTLDHGNYFNLFSRGVGIDLGAGLSLVFGVLSTQTYAQAVISAKSDREARKGSLISAILIPPIGVGGIFIGMYARGVYMTSTEVAAAGGLAAGFTEIAATKQIFPQFLLDNMPELVAGIFLATLLIASVGTGAGLSLGISTIIQKDILARRKKYEPHLYRDLLIGRVLILVVLILAASMSTGTLGSVILEFSFLSMALRAGAVFMPLAASLFMPGKVDHRFAVASIIIGPVAMIANEFLPIALDPVFPGMALTFLIVMFGRFAKKTQSERLA